MEKMDIFEVVRSAETNYLRGSVKRGEHVTFSMYDTIEKIIAYTNSRHTSGEKDSLGRDKPFFNIVTAAENIWFKATDIDRKDIIIRPTKKSHVALAFVGTVLLQNWMRKTGFGKFLNSWGRTMSRYGGAVSKWIERDGKLIATVIPWNRMICDPIDFYALPRIEKLYFTPAQLRDKTEYDQIVVESLISATVARKDLRGSNKDSISRFIEIYEVHGELPKALLKKNPRDNDWINYDQQMHVISYVKSKEERGKYEDFTLYKGIEAQDPYSKDDLLEEEGRTLPIGAVEYLFDAQWMTNHSYKNMKDTLDLGSRLLMQSADARFVGKNVLTNMETGDILTHNLNMPLSLLNNDKSNTIISLMAFAQSWRVIGQEISSTPEATRGINPPASQPYSTTALITGQANSLFEIMIENKALALEDKLRKFVIPHLKKKMNNKNEIAAVLEDHDIHKIDSMWVPKAAIKVFNAIAKEAILSGRPVQPFNRLEVEAVVKQDLAQLGNQRFLNSGDVNWNKALENLEWELEVGISNESSDKVAILESLTTLYKTIIEVSKNPDDPRAKLIFDKIVSQTGVVSPLELSSASTAQPFTAVNPEKVAI